MQQDALRNPAVQSCSWCVKRAKRAGTGSGRRSGPMLTACPRHTSTPLQQQPRHNSRALLLPIGGTQTRKGKHAATIDSQPTTTSKQLRHQPLEHVAECSPLQHCVVPKQLMHGMVPETSRISNRRLAFSRPTTQRLFGGWASQECHFVCGLPGRISRFKQSQRVQRPPGQHRLGRSHHACNHPRSPHGCTYTARTRSAVNTCNQKQYSRQGAAADATQAHGRRGCSQTETYRGRSGRPSANGTRIHVMQLLAKEPKNGKSGTHRARRTRAGSWTRQPSSASQARRHLASAGTCGGR